jgi:hypothetical protein
MPAFVFMQACVCRLIAEEAEEKEKEKQKKRIRRRKGDEEENGAGEGGGEGGGEGEDVVRQSTKFSQTHSSLGEAGGTCCSGGECRFSLWLSNEKKIGHQ